MFVDVLIGWIGTGGHMINVEPDEAVPIETG